MGGPSTPAREERGADAAVRFRMATANDLDALVDLEVSVFDPPWTADQIVQFWAAPGASGWLAEDTEGCAVAFALFREFQGEAELLRVATRPSWQRRQIARRLLDRALAELDRGGAVCFLELRSDNLAAQELYARLAFERSGLRRKYYQDGCDAWLYVRRPPL